MEIWLLVVPVVMWLWLGLTWTMYLAGLSLYKVDQGSLPMVVRPFAFMIKWVGTVANWVWNGVFGTMLFLELPKELYFSARVGRHKNSSSGWRHKLAMFFCSRLLDPFDEKHCDKAVGV